jgi:hypothetical protein
VLPLSRLGSRPSENGLSARRHGCRAVNWLEIRYLRPLCGGEAEMSVLSGRAGREDEAFGFPAQACTARINRGTPMRVMARLIL